MGSEVINLALQRVILDLEIVNFFLQVINISLQSDVGLFAFGANLVDIRRMF